MYKENIGQPMIFVLKTRNYYNIPYIYRGVVIDSNENLVEINEIKLGIIQISQQLIERSEIIPKKEWIDFKNSLYNSGKKLSILDALKIMDRRVDDGLKRDMKKTTEELKKADDILMGRKKHDS